MLIVGFSSTVYPHTVCVFCFFDGLQSVLFFPCNDSLLFFPDLLFIFVVLMFSRSHCSKSLVTGANIFSTHPTFQSRVSPIEARHSENALRVLANAQPHFIPSRADQN